MITGSQLLTAGRGGGSGGCGTGISLALTRVSKSVDKVRGNVQQEVPVGQIIYTIERPLAKRTVLPRVCIVIGDRSRAPPPP